MADIDSGIIVQNQVFAQPIEPEITRDGTVWIDTSGDSNDRYIYSADSGEWTPTRQIYAQDTPPSGVQVTDGTVWIDTGAENRTTYVYSSDAGEFVVTNRQPKPTTSSSLFPGLFG